MDTQNYIGHKYRWIFAGVLALAFVICYSYTFDSKLALLGDNASYYTLGKAIAQGEGYVNISKAHKSPNNHYPPGYPAIMSTILIFSDSIVAVKLLNGLFLAGSIALCFLLLARLTENFITSFIVCLLTICNAHVLFYGSLMMSEVPYMFFSLLAIYLITSDEDLSMKYLGGALIAMVIAYYVRSLGVALLAGFALHFLMKKDWKKMSVSIGSLFIGGLPWFIRGQSLGGTSYMNQLKMINPYNPGLGEASISDFIDRFWSNFTRYITREIPDAIFNFGPNYNSEISGIEWFFGFLILSLIGFGLYQLKNYRWLLIGYMLGTLGILMIWPDVWIGVRFIVPVVPLFLIGLINGFFSLFKILRRQSEVSMVVNYAPIIVALFLISPMSELSKKAKAPYPPAWQRYFEVAEWLNQNEENKVISCGKPSLFYTYADNFTMRYKFTKDASELIAQLERQKVDYVVIDQVYGNTFQYLLPAVRQYPDRFQQVLHLKSPDTFLLKFKR